MPKYRKKPVVVEAIQWTGENREEIESFMNEKDCIFGAALSETRYINNCISYKDYDVVRLPIKLYITTLEGTMEADIGDYIIKGVHGEYYPCKPDIFEETYEKVEYNS